MLRAERSAMTVSRRACLLAVGSLFGALASSKAPAASKGLASIEAGHGRSVVIFLHGWGQSAAYWEPWVRWLGGCGVHAIALDLPGFGASIDAPGPYTLDGLAESVGQFISEHRLGAVALVGNAMGSTVAQLVALNHPRLVSRLVLTATSAGAAVPPANRRTREAARTMWRTPQAVDGFFARKAAPAQYARRFYAAMETMSFDAAYEADQSNQSWSTYERLDLLTSPTLIIQGAEDRLKSPAEGRRMAARLPNARLVVLTNAAHTPQWDQPRAFGEALLPFLLQGQPAHLQRGCAPLANSIDWGN